MLMTDKYSELLHFMITDFVQWVVEIKCQLFKLDFFHNCFDKKCAHTVASGVKSL